MWHGRLGRRRFGSGLNKLYSFFRQNTSGCCGTFCLFVLLGEFLVSGRSANIDFCALVQGTFDAQLSIAGSCDVFIELATFLDIQSSSKVGAVYLENTSLALSITITVFEGCRTTRYGGAVFAYARELGINRTCFSHCDSPGHGKHLYVQAKYSSGDCTFYASYSKGETSSSTAGDAVRVNDLPSASVCYFRSENHTRSDSSLGSSSSGAVDCDWSTCVVRRQYSTFMDCPDDLILWVHNGSDPVATIEYTNFLSNTLLFVSNHRQYSTVQCDYADGNSD
jgi:hypothetical protein